MAKDYALSRFLGKPIAGYLAVFLIAAAFFAYIQWSAGFADPDSFYHIKMTMLTMRSGPVTEFPWLPRTVLANGFADHHFLYHLILIPFFWLAGPLIGMKIATVALAAGCVTVFYGMLRSFGLARLAFWMSLLLASSGGFFFRINLAKTPAMAVAWFMLELMALHRRRYWTLGLLAFGHVWLHASWPLAAAAAAGYLASAWAVEATAGRQLAAKAALKRIWSEQRGALGAVAVGLAAGLTVNPFFPANLRFYWEQLVQIALINYSHVLDVGTEWLPYSPADIYRQAAMLFNVLIATIVVLLILRDERSLARQSISRGLATLTIFAAGLTGVFMLMTMRQSRHIELLTPALGLLDACLLAVALTGTTAKALLAELKRLAGPRLGSAWFMAGLAVFLTARFVAADAPLARNFQANRPFDRYSQAVQWLAGHAEPGSLVVNSRWDDFPNLFFLEDSLKYFTGLDPTFAYRADPGVWREQQDIQNSVEGRPAPSELLRKVGGQFYFLRRDDGLPADFSHDPSLKLAYHDDEAVIFRLK